MLIGSQKPPFSAAQENETCGCSGRAYCPCWVSTVLPHRCPAQGSELPDGLLIHSSRQ